MKNAIKIFAFAVLSLCLFQAVGVRAQTASTPQVYITWRTVDGAAPANYAGKILPKTGSQIAASVEVISAGGSLANLGGQTIYWYLDDNFIGGGVGKQSITFNAPGNVKILSLRVNIPNYPGGSLINTAHVRMVNPHVALVASYPNRQFSGTAVELRAVPYFFAAKDLGKLFYQWTVNGQIAETEGNPQNLAIQLNNNPAAGYKLNINLAVAQNNDPFVRIRESLTLTKSN